MQYAERGAAAGDARGLSRRGVLGAALASCVMPVGARALPLETRHEDERLMREALAEAARGDFPFGTVIARDGQILARGRNLGRQQQDPTAHGEMVGIRAFLARHGPARLRGTTLYTSGEPCAMCMGAILWCGVGRLVYAASVEQLAAKIAQILVPSAEIASRTPFARIAITGGVLAAEAAGAVPLIAL
jgi:tRNA(adenine34) deaminase